MNVLSVVGARPQFVKAAAVSRVLRAAPGVREVLVHTGQHYDDNMSGVFFEELKIPEPDHHLGVGSGPHGRQTGRMLEALEAVILREAPDWVLVYGDTNSTLAGALAAAKLHVPVAHVEAGLRSFNRRMPEEVNRVLTDHAADLLLVPTETAEGNLRAEGVAPARIRRVGDVMYDAALFYAERARVRSRILGELGLSPGGYALATIHRAETTDAPAVLARVIRALCAAGRALPVVLPLHPRTRKALGEAGLLEEAARGLRLVDPVGYLDMIRLEGGARVVLTDSGGVQKEAYFQRVPCITLRGETEWVELVEAGWNRLVPPANPEFEEVLPAIVQEAAAPAHWEPLYGNGDAAHRILSALAEGITKPKGIP